MRICSLVPGATEIVAMLGSSGDLVGISHECDYPPTLHHIPIMVEPLVDSGVLGSEDIDRQVKALASSGRPLYRLSKHALVEARPDIILTQDVCHVCAVTPEDLEQAILSLPTRPRILSLNPRSVFDVIEDVERIGEALGKALPAADLARSLRERLAAVRNKSTGRPRPRVLCLEWLSPLYIGGHWVPEMVDLAGGQDVLGRVGQPSRQVTWDEVRAGAPDITVLMPCGFSTARTVSELTALCRADVAYSHAIMSMPKLYVVDAGSYFSRPGPRLVDGVTLLAEIVSGSPASDSSAVRDLTGSVALTGS